MVKLIDLGVDINLPSVNGTTALHLTCQFSSLDDSEMAELLLQHGADADFKDKVVEKRSK